MNDTWDEYAEDWDANGDVVAYSNKAFQKLTEIVSLEGLEVFDFGCGTGQLTEKLSPLVKNVVALDTSRKMIEILEAKNLANVTAICDQLANLNGLKAATGHSTFDLVTASSVCAFVTDYPDTAQRLKSILKPQGIFVQWDWYSESEASGPGFTKDRIQEVLEGVGFSIVTVSTAFTMASPEGEMTVLMAVGKL